MKHPKLLFNDEGQLRSGLRVAVFLFLGVLLAVPVIPVAAVAASWLETRGFLPAIFANAAALCAVSLIAGWLCLRFLEGLPFSSLGCSPKGLWLRNLGFGLLVGGATFGLACLLGVVTGSLSFEVNGAEGAGSMIASMGISLAALAAAAAFEEAFFRGYAFQTLVRANLSWLAIAATSLLFGAAHLMNPNSSKIAVVNTVLAGVWFGIAYLKTRDLWFPFGLHLAWNWVQGNIFGIEISGLSSLMSVSLLKEIEHGPDWLSGGSYGVEGGIVCTAALSLSIALILWVPTLKRFPVDSRQ